MEGKARSEKSCLEELMELSFEKMKKEFDAPKLREIAKKSMRKKRDLQKATENPSKKKK
jgi:hypothetical protein